MVAKAEHLSKGSNPRFVVTSLPVREIDARTLYEKVYCVLGPHLSREDLEAKARRAHARKLLEKKRAEAERQAFK